jgi:uncharacterized Fe-S cluster-containing radical SAM superfamily protein
MHEMKVSKFLYETLAGGYTNQLPIASVCNGHCFFCSNDMNPFPIFREGFRPLEDVKRGIALLDPGSPAEIRIGDSLPGRVSEGEALRHPQIFDILKLIRQKIPNKVIQANTNGTVLTPEFIDKLKAFQPMRFSISYHSDTPEHWCRIFGLGEKDFQTARKAFFHLTKEKFMVEGVIVPLPSLVGWDDIEKTVNSLRPFIGNLIIYPPGFSDLASQELKKALDTDYAEMSLFFQRLRKNFRLNIQVMSDPLRPLDFHPAGFMQRTAEAKHKNVLWLFSEAAFEKASRILEAQTPFVTNAHHPWLVKNLTYGGNIVCAGLLMVKDFETALEKALEDLGRRDIRPDLFILPQIAFDRFGEDLTGVPYSRLGDRWDIPVWLG